MIDFKLGDKVVFKDGDGWGQHWTTKGMKGIVVALRGNSVPDNIMVEATTEAGAKIVAEFRPDRWELDKVKIKVMTVSVAHQIAHSDAEIGVMQAEYQNELERLEGMKAALAKRMEEHTALLMEYGVEDI